MLISPIRTLILLLFGFLATNCSSEPELAVNALKDGPEPVSSALTKSLHDHLKLVPDQTQVALALISGEKTRFLGIERSNDTLFQINNQERLFEIGSITKVFTATLLAELVSEGRVRPDDLAAAHFPSEWNTGSGITLESLANHTSGLPRLPSNMGLFTTDPDNPYKSYDSEKLATYLAKERELTHAPGTHYEYSNLGAGILGYLLAEVEGKTYEQLLQERIFSNYQMTHTTTNRLQAGDKLVPGRDPEGDITPNWDFDVLAGAGGILSSVEELSHFARAQFDPGNTVLQLTQRPTFTIDENTRIGLGWHLLKRKNGQELLWHNGGTGGYSTSMILDPQNQYGVILLSNLSAMREPSGIIDQLGFELMNQMGKLTK